MAMQQLIKIAIVEDDAFFNKSIERYIKNLCNQQFRNKYEFELYTYRSARAALTQLPNDLNIMVLDYHLFDPNQEDQLTGEDVLLATRIKCQTCKIILLSGMINPWKVVDLRTKGIYKYINKNTNSVDRIGNILRHTFKNDLRA